MTARAGLEAAAQRLAAEGVPDARREARLLLLAAGGPDPLLDPQAPLDPVAGTFYAMVRRRRAREPFAYIVGHREFYGLRLSVRPGVLVPRPETEGLVEHALALAPAAGRVADLCTGSGAVAAALAVERPDLVVDAVDISPAALEVARDNIAALRLQDRVRLHQGDLWAALPEGSYNLCTCNAPYVTEAEWEAAEPEVRRWEPQVALVAPEGWPALYRRLAEGAVGRLVPGGHLLAEIGAGQGEGIAAVFQAAGLGEVRILPDLAGRPRYAVGRCR